MQPLKSTATFFYGLGLAGIAGLQFVYPWFRPVILPVPAEDTRNLHFLVYITGALLALAGIAIAARQKVHSISLAVAWLLLLLFLAGHLPNRLANNPGFLGAWTDALKILCLSGGAFVISTVYPGKNNSGFSRMAGTIAGYGKYFFALLLVVFGLDHFLYAGFVQTLVPSWIPGALFWTYFAGVALIGAGLAIFINFKPRTISLLLAIMLFAWLLVLHIPRAIAAPATDSGNEWTSVFECLAFCGIALLYPYAKRE